MLKYGTKHLNIIRTIIPKSNSGFTRWNLFFYPIMATGIFPQIYPIMFCTTWGVFVSFNSAPLLDSNAFRSLAHALEMKNMLMFHVVYNFAAHGLPCVFLIIYPPNVMYWWSGIFAACLHAGWGAYVSNGTMLLNEIYIPLRPEFWALMWSSAIITELIAPFIIYPAIMNMLNNTIC